MAWHPTGRARVNAQNPSAFGICDRCSFQYQRNALRWQYQFQGFGLQNLNILVCSTCLDAPQPQLKAIILPPDPVPVWEPRPEPYAIEVPSFVSTTDGDNFVTGEGDNLTTEIRVTPSPDPDNPYYFAES